MSSTSMFNLAAHANNLLLEDSGRGWTGFNQDMTNFFKNGMGNGGFKGVGIALMIVGILLAAVSFAMHHFNPQSRLPSWGICLVVAIIGGILGFGVETPIKFLESCGHWIEHLLGF